MIPLAVYIAVQLIGHAMAAVVFIREYPEMDQC